ncbi:MAG: glycosyltransferase, partial [Candidatus Omnitrophota bacterium]|nr:glycosyltransferase [Candidatus Omnitrophota bacterium]
MRIFLAILTLSGFSFFLWTLIGIIRFIAERAPGLVHETLSRRAADGMHPIFDGQVSAGTLYLFLSTFIVVVASAFIGSYSILSGATPFQLFLWLVVPALGGYMATRLIGTHRLSSTFFIWNFFFTALHAFVPDMDPTRYLLTAEEAIFVLGASFLAVLSGTYLATLVAESEQISDTLVPISSPGRIYPIEVAALIPAHNEESGIVHTIESLKCVMPVENIYVASDASTDKTVAIAKAQGVNVLDIWPNKGKAGALAYAIEQFALGKRFKVLMIVDADAEVAIDYLKKGLP